jgi:Asp-tRNA(Asn)/Glu-tRNA(Gln) amidotransferase A subunit family amidase
MTSRTPKPRSYLTAAAEFAGGQSTPRDFLEGCLAELEAWEPQIGAFVCVDIASARAAADRAGKRWRAGRPLSAIDGMPVGIKDIIETVDMPTQMGSPLFEGWRSHKDAASVAALRQAGAVILGKTVTTEFAATEPRGTRNPWNPAHTPGGSSSGSAAAVAAGMVTAALGTQVIGSVIRPASYCGVIGFKPTVGAINREGGHDYQSQSCTGILGASLADVWQVAVEIVQRVGGDAGTPGLTGPMQAPAAQKPRRLALIETSGWPKASTAARQCLEDVVARLAADGIVVTGRGHDRAIEAIEHELTDAFRLSNEINGFEGRWFIRGCRDRDPDKLSRVMHDRLAQNEHLTLQSHRAALDTRARIRAAYAELARDYDACITLAAPGPAPAGLNSTGDPQFAVPSSLLGVPALSLPLFQIDGLPLGLQLIGFANEDAALFSRARWMLETAGQKHA